MNTSQVSSVQHSVKVIASSDVTSCSSIDGYLGFGTICCLKGGGSEFFRNVGSRTTNRTLLHRIRLYLDTYRRENLSLTEQLSV
jgi:hypothetical protein